VDAEAPAVAGAGEDDVALLGMEGVALVIVLLAAARAAAVFVVLERGEVVAGAQRGVDGVDLGDDAAEARVSVLGREEEVGDEAVHLVEDEAGAQALDERLAKRGVGLDADALGRVDDDERRVREARGGGDLGAEVGVARGVDQVHAVDARGVRVPERDGGGLHGDGAPLLLREVVHEPGASRQLRAEEAAAAGGH